MCMKKLILIVLILIFVSGLLFLVWGSIQKLQEKNQLAEEINRLPQFSLLSLENDSFSSSEIEEGPLLIVNFHPDCEHCQYEISELLNSNIIESDIKLILVTFAVPDTVRKFLKGCNHAGKHNFTTLIDTAFIFGDIFGRNYIPSNYLYDRELNLIEVFYGEYKTETIIKCFNLSEQD